VKDKGEKIVKLRLCDGTVLLVLKKLIGSRYDAHAS